MARPRSVFDTLTDAVNDLAANGYDSEERVAFWRDAIRRAAEAAGKSAADVERMARSSLGTVYHRLVDRTGLLKFHPGVARFTIDRVRPQLRAELDRRIRASADLIKLNRRAAIEKTLQRFSGWATSVPKGGMKTTDKVETKAGIGKALKDLPFTERRCMIDQSSKLVASINDIVAVGGGAIAAVWSSRFRQHGYNYRPDHKERDGKVYLIRNSWAHEKGLVKPGSAGYTDQITQPAEEVFCLPGDSVVHLFQDAEKAYRRFYAGEIVTLTFVDGTSISATPNHPIMTTNGWVAIGCLNKGDNVIKTGGEGVQTAKLYAQERASTFTDLFTAMRKASLVEEIRDGMRPNFHGDGTDEKIDIVSLARPLWMNTETVTSHDISKGLLAFADSANMSVRLLFEPIRRLLSASNGVVRFGSSQVAMPVHGSVQFILRTKNLSQSLDDSRRRYAKRFGDLSRILTRFVSRSNIIKVRRDPSRTAEAWTKVDKTLRMPIPDGHRSDAEGGGDLLKRFTFPAKACDIVRVDRGAFSGHVYNLQTMSGWYSANGVITSNCRCSYRYLYALRDLPDEMVTQHGRDELERVRAQIRSGL